MPTPGCLAAASSAAGATSLPSRSKIARSSGRNRARSAPGASSGETRSASSVNRGATLAERIASSPKVLLSWTSVLTPSSPDSLATCSKTSRTAVSPPNSASSAATALAPCRSACPAKNSTASFAAVRTSVPSCARTANAGKATKSPAPSNTIQRWKLSIEEPSPCPLPSEWERFKKVPLERVARSLALNHIELVGCTAQRFP